MANIAWLQEFSHVQVEVLAASISDHALLRIQMFDIRQAPKRNFKFINAVLDIPDFQETVKRSWNEPIRGRAMYVVWHKLKRL